MPRGWFGVFGFPVRETFGSGDPGATDGLDSYLLLALESTPEARAVRRRLKLIVRNADITVRSMTSHVYRRSVRFLLVAVMAVALPLLAQRYTYRQYGPAQGLTDLDIDCLLQDHTGYIWAGTSNGLFRYDGTTFRKFGMEDGLPSSMIAGLAEAPDGTLWVATIRGIARMSGLRFEAVNTGGTGPVLSIKFDRHGRVYATHHSGIIRGTPSAGNKYVFSTIVQGSTGPMFAKGDDFWFGKDGGIWHLEGDVAQPAGSVPDLPKDKWVPSIDQWGNLWVRSRSLLYELPQGAAHFVNQSSQIRSGGANNLYAGSDGLYVSTSFGVVILSGSQRVYLDSEHGLPMEEAGPVLVDRSGSLWVGSQGGGLVRRLGHGEWLSWKKEDGLPANNIWAVLHDPNGLVWIGTPGGLSLIDPTTNTVLHQPVTPTAQTNAVMGIARSPTGEIFVTTDKLTIDRYNSQGKLLGSYGRSSGLLIDQIHSTVFDREGRLWVIGYPACLRSKEPVGKSNTIHFEDVSIPGLAFHDARQSAVDDSGNLWVTLTAGLARFDGSQWKIFDQHDGLKTGAVGAIATKNGELWISYRDALGVSHITPHGDRLTVTHYDRKNGLTSDQVFAIAIDSQNRVWAGTDNGVDIRDGASWHHNGTDDGLIWDDTNGQALSSDTDGRVWVGTSGGLSRFAPLQSSEAAEPAILTSIQGVSQEWSATDRPTLSHAKSSLVVHFSDLDYSAESSMQYRYRIVGYDPGWHETQERALHLDRLPPGSYRFEVQAARRGGMWDTSAATFSFTIMPAWWQSWWFVVSCLIGFGLVARATWRLRIRNLEAQKASLEILVESRTSQLRESNCKLEKSNCQLEQIAHCDTLTTLPNRRRFNENLQERIGRVRYRAQFSLLLIDLDRFKYINDTFGHDAGDAVLVETACRLRSAVRENDCVARLGGDEFAILMDDLDDGEASLIIVCNRIIGLLTHDFVFGSLRLSVGCSIGVASFPRDGEMQEALFKSADLALYESKRNGRGVYQFFSHAIQGDLGEHAHPVDEHQ
jgi:diguanylate cyclase (GGDEF)-like protein